MKATINNFQIDLSKPMDISIPLSSTNENPIAWYLEKPEISPEKMGIGLAKFPAEVLRQTLIIFFLILMDTARTPNVWGILHENFTA